MAEKVLLDEKQLATKLHISVASARRWRLLHQGPRFLKIGAAVRYRPEDVDAWLNSRPAGGDPANPTGESGERFPSGR
jgi:predicted DNA-binding transcriptional regulator AlpA